MGNPSSAGHVAALAEKAKEIVWNGGFTQNRNSSSADRPQIAFGSNSNKPGKNTSHKMHSKKDNTNDLGESSSDADPNSLYDQIQLPVTTWKTKRNRPQHYYGITAFREAHPTQGQPRLELPVPPDYTKNNMALERNRDTAWNDLSTEKRQQMGSQQQYPNHKPTQGFTWDGPSYESTAMPLTSDKENEYVAYHKKRDQNHQKSDKQHVSLLNTTPHEKTEQKININRPNEDQTKKKVEENRLIWLLLLSIACGSLAVILLVLQFTSHLPQSLCALLISTTVLLLVDVICIGIVGYMTINPRFDKKTKIWLPRTKIFNSIVLTITSINVWAAFSFSIGNPKYCLAFIQPNFLSLTDTCPASVITGPSITLSILLLFYGALTFMAFRGISRQSNGTNWQGYCISSRAYSYGALSFFFVLSITQSGLYFGSLPSSIMFSGMVLAFVMAGTLALLAAISSLLTAVFIYQESGTQPTSKRHRYHILMKVTKFLAFFSMSFTCASGFISNIDEFSCINFKGQSMLFLSSKAFSSVTCPSSTVNVPAILISLALLYVAALMIFFHSMRMVKEEHKAKFRSVDASWKRKDVYLGIGE